MNAEANTVEDQNIDRRVRKTKKQLRQALMDLMSEKPSKSISVRELAERADITVRKGALLVGWQLPPL